MSSLYFLSTALSVGPKLHFLAFNYRRLIRRSRALIPRWRRPLGRSNIRYSNIVVWRKAQRVYSTKFLGFFSRSRRVGVEESLSQHHFLIREESGGMSRALVAAFCSSFRLPVVVGADMVAMVKVKVMVEVENESFARVVVAISYALHVLVPFFVLCYYSPCASNCQFMLTINPSDHRCCRCLVFFPPNILTTIKISELTPRSHPLPLFHHLHTNNRLATQRKYQLNKPAPWFKTYTDPAVLAKIYQQHFQNWSPQSSALRKHQKILYSRPQSLPSFARKGTYRYEGFLVPHYTSRSHLAVREVSRRPAETSVADVTQQQALHCLQDGYGHIIPLFPYSFTHRWNA